MKLLLIANLVLASNFVSGNTISHVASKKPSSHRSCNIPSTQDLTTFFLELNNGSRQLDVSGQSLMGFAYSEPGFLNYTNTLLTTGSPQHIYVETGKAFNAINHCYAKFPGYSYTWKGIGDDGAIIARVAAEKAKASQFPTSETPFQKTFQIMDNTTLVDFEVNGNIVSVANGKGQDIQFQGNLTKHLAPSPEFVSFQGYLYVYVPESGSLINFDGLVQVCNGTASETVGIGGILTESVYVPPHQGLVDPAGVEGFLVLPTIPPIITAAAIFNETTGTDQIVVTVGNDTKVLDAAPIVGLANADPNFLAYFYSVSLGQSTDITESTHEAYILLSDCNIITSK